MASPRDTTLTRLTALILAPVLLLAVIAVFGLLQYRNTIREEARAEAGQHASPRQVERALTALAEEARGGPEVILYREIPEESDSPSPAAARLKAAIADEDRSALRDLLDTPGTTGSGLPVRVLAGWKLVRLSGESEAAERLATLVIDEAPSTISGPILQDLAKQFPTLPSPLERWETSEKRRSILRRHANRDGLVRTEGGAAFILENRVLTPSDVQEFFRDRRTESTIPSWMTLDFVAFDTSLVSPVQEPLANSGSELQIVAGIGDRESLYTRYWSIAWWVATLILCALLTACLGIWLARRTVLRERRLNELKNQFVASVSHELRAPVASMRLMADALDAGTVTGDKARGFHRLISQEGARLSSLIENVLEFARIEEGRRRYRFSETDLPALVTDTIRLMEPVAAERRVRIEPRLTNERAAPSLDSTAIQQALVNLLDNAIKFSPKGTTILVHLDAAEDRWELRVADAGPGIPADDRSRIFQRFTRLENELRRETQGAGIGLSIVQHAVEAHRGTVHVEDRNGGGAVFVIGCPSRNDPQSDEAPPAGELAVDLETGNATS